MDFKTNSDVLCLHAPLKGGACLAEPDVPIPSHKTRTSPFPLSPGPSQQRPQVSQQRLHLGGWFDLHPKSLPCLPLLVLSLQSPPVEPHPSHFRPLAAGVIHYCSVRAPLSPHCSYLMSGSQLPGGPGRLRGWGCLDPGKQPQWVSLSPCRAPSLLTKTLPGCRFMSERNGLF